MEPKIKYLVTCIICVLALGVVSGAGARAQQTYQATAVRPAAITGDLIDLPSANDTRPDTRAYSSGKDYVGMSVTMDLGGEQNVIGVRQEHGRWPSHYPGAFRVEVAASPSGPWFKAFEGAGTTGESKAIFPAIRARYIRITATAKNTRYPDAQWSIAELRGGVDPGQTPRTIPTPPATGPDTTPAPELAFRDVSLAWDRRLNTRATSGTPNYAGMRLTYDLGGEYEVSRVVQLHGQWRDEYPGEYRVEVSRENNERRFQQVWRGRGEPARSVARFDPVVTRYIRITAIRNQDDSRWWSIAELRTNRDEDEVVQDDDERDARPIRDINANGFRNAAALLNANNTTSVTTGTARYVGSWLQADLGGSYTISKVIQEHGPDIEAFPGRYRVEVSEDGNRWQTVHEGEGSPERTRATFRAVRARYVRVTAITNRDLRHWWTLNSLKIKG
jgi:F5/8 type C domain